MTETSSGKSDADGDRQAFAAAAFVLQCGNVIILRDQPLPRNIHSRNKVAPKGWGA